MDSIIVAGASAGGVEALTEFVSGLPPLPVPVLVVLHMSPSLSSRLPQILGRSGRLPAAFASDGQAMQAGHIYVAPPDHHLLVQGGHMLVRKGPKENRFRPSIDALFRSAAYTHGPGAIGIILSGVLEDGIAGLAEIKLVGGTAIAQDPREAAFPSMPEQALSQVDIDHCLPVREIGALLGRLTRESVMEPEAEADDAKHRDRMKLELSVAAGDNALRQGIMDIGPPSAYTCPECHGVLLQVKSAGMLRFRCHTGHAYTAGALLSATLERIEHNYGQAMASLEEAALLFHGLGKEHAQRGDEASGALFLDHARNASEQSDRLREVIQNSALFKRVPK